MAATTVPCRCGRNAYAEDTCVYCGTGERPAPALLRPRYPAEPNTRRFQDRRAWSEQYIVAAIRRWHRETGRTPRQHEWTCGGAWWPSYTRVIDIFDTWKAAIRAAGYEPPAQGRPARQKATA